MSGSAASSAHRSLARELRIPETLIATILASDEAPLGSVVAGILIRRFCGEQSFRSERAHRVGASRAPHRQPAREKPNKRKQDCDATNDRGISGAHAIEQEGQNASDGQRPDHTERRTPRDETRRVAHDHPDYRATIGAKCHPDSDLVCALSHGIHHHTVDTNRGNDQSNHGEYSKKCHE